MIIEIYKTRTQLLVRKPTFKTRYFFRIKGNNGEIIAQSEGYTQKHNVTEVISQYFPSADVTDLSVEKPYKLFL